MVQKGGAALDEICTVRLPAPQGVFSPAELSLALQAAADVHATDLNIDFDRMRRDFSCLWMIVRARAELSRPPMGEFSVQTSLRRPSAATSARDFSLFDAQGQFARAVQLWALVEEEKRKMVDLRRIAPLWEIPTAKTESDLRVPRLALPALQDMGTWTVEASEIDKNGHLNNVAYLRRVQSFAPRDFRAMTLYYDRECFLGETLRIEAAGGCARIVGPDGSERFRCRFE